MGAIRSASSTQERFHQPGQPGGNDQLKRMRPRVNFHRNRALPIASRVRSRGEARALVTLERCSERYGHG